MRPHTLTTSLVLFAGAFLLVLLGSAALSITSTLAMQQNVEHLSEEVIIQIAESGSFNTSVTRAIREIQTTVLEGDEDEIDELEEALEEADGHLAALIELEERIQDHNDLHAIYGELNPRRRALLDELSAIGVQLRADSDLSEAEIETLFEQLEENEEVLADLDRATDEALRAEQALAISGASESVSQTVLSIALGLVGLLVMIALAVWQFRRQLISPIDELVTANKAFAEGTLTDPVVVRGQYEIGQLQIAFNRMVEMIRSQTRTLVEQAHVADRIRARAQEAEGLARRLQQQNDQIADQAAALRVEIAEREQAELALIQARDAAQAANRAKSTFLATMSHELRTPLTAILGYSQLMSRFVDTGDYSQVRNDLDMIQKAGQHLSTLINDVLDLSRIEAGKMTLNISEVQVAEILQQVADTTRPLVEKNGSTLIIDCPPSVTSIKTDALKLRQVLLNLLSNAAKFTHEGQVTLTVSVPDADRGAQGEHGADHAAAALHHPSSVILFEVRDTGIGIASDQITRLFEPFVQVDGSPTRKYGGSGLGLALSRNLCRMLGGDILVESSYGQGSTFTVMLPCKSAPLPAEYVPPPPPADMAQQLAAADSEARQLVGDTIALVIDDDPVVGDLLRRLLIPHNVDVVTAASGAEGIELARDLLPDVILLDVIMAQPDGWAVLAALKNDPDLADTPVIMISIDDQRERGLALGVTDYLLKPLDQQRLVALVQRYTAQYRGEPTSLGGSLLVVEDDEPLCRLFQRSFELEGWQVQTASSGRIALDAVAAAPPAAIVLDLMLPELDGVQVIARLRENPAWRSIPIFVVTARDLSPAERAQLAGSVTHIFQKGSAQISDLVADLQRLITTVVEAS